MTLYRISGSLIDMTDTDLIEVLGSVKEGLVVRPGDHLVLSFPAETTGEHVAELLEVLRERFRPLNIDFTVIAGASEMLVIGQDDEAFAKRVLDIVWREVRRGRVAWPKP